MRWLLMILVGFLAVLGIAASVAHYLTDPYQPGFLAFPLMTALHVVLGAIYLALAPLQFLQQIRTRWFGYHRWAGRLLVAIGLVIGITALFMGFVIPAAGWPQTVIITDTNLQHRKG